MGRGHYVRELIRGASNAGDARGGKLHGVLLVEGGAALVIQGEERDHAHAAVLAISDHSVISPASGFESSRGSVPMGALPATG